MDQKKKRGAWKYRPVRVHIVLRVYAVIFGLLGLMLLAWGRIWFPASLFGPPFGGATQVQVFAAVFLAAAGCSAALAAVDDAQIQGRGLFWFGVGHVALWLVLVAKLKFVWGWMPDGRPGPGDNMVAIVGVTAFASFFLWLIAEGELPLGPLNAPGTYIQTLSTVPAEPLRSQYEQKIRQAAAQEERNRLARDLHDSIKQQIFAIQTAAATAQTRLSVDANQGDANGAREALEEIRSAAREAMTEMEVMLDQLRAEPLENTGLVVALKKLCESIGFRTGAQVEFKMGAVPPNDQLAPGAAEATLRVAQEALANVARHARASHVTVTLDSAEGRMELTVEDDGAGFDPKQDSRGMGTANMRARAEEFGGRLDLSSSRAAGTTVKFSIPSASPARYGGRLGLLKRRIISGLFALTILFNAEVHHWSFAPLLVFTSALAVAHYLKTRHLMTQMVVRRLNQPAL